MQRFTRLLNLIDRAESLSGQNKRRVWGAVPIASLHLPSLEVLALNMAPAMDLPAGTLLAHIRENMPHLTVLDTGEREFQASPADHLWRTDGPADKKYNEIYKTIGKKYPTLLDV